MSRTVLLALVSLGAFSAALYLRPRTAVELAMRERREVVYLN